MTSAGIAAHFAWQHDAPMFWTVSSREIVREAVPAPWCGIQLFIVRGAGGMTGIGAVKFPTLGDLPAVTCR